MSLRIIGYTPTGTRIVIDEGPSRAHLITRGGALVTAIPTPQHYHGHPGRSRRRAELRAAGLSRKETRG